MMKSLWLMIVATALVTAVAACGGAPQEQPASAGESQVAEPTPVFEDDFESGEAESWTEGDEVQVEDEIPEDASGE